MREIEAIIDELLHRLSELLRWLDQLNSLMQQQHDRERRIQQQLAQVLDEVPEPLPESTWWPDELRDTLQRLASVVETDFFDRSPDSFHGGPTILCVTLEPLQHTSNRIEALCEECRTGFAALDRAVRDIRSSQEQERIMQFMETGRILCNEMTGAADWYAQMLRKIAEEYMAMDDMMADVFSGGSIGFGGSEGKERGTAADSPQQKETKAVSATESAPQVQMDDVQFRLAAPEALNRDEYALVKLMMYEGDDYARADREAQQLADRVKQNSSSLYPVARGEKLRVCLQSEDVEIEDPSQELVWNGKYASCDFEVLVPGDFAPKQARIKARVYQGFAVLTDLRLILNVTGERPVSEPAEMCRYRSAFLSYASQDRPKVIGCLRGMRLMRDDLDVFMDVISLRRGEYYEQRIMEEIDRRDLFYLFWSRNAAQSEWVKKELAYALEKKSVDRIEPVPLETPELCPPPKALNDRHFNDWLLRYEQQQYSEE